MTDKLKVVIVGGVAAGPKTGATLARRLPDAEIILFQKEKNISYGTCGLPYYASGDINSFDELTFTAYGTPRNIDFFAKSKGFRVITEVEVTEIDRDKKQIKARNLNTGDTITQEYDKLVLTTGATPITPPFSVPDNPNIRSFTRPDDAIHFRSLAEKGQIEKAIIIGGGFIGCEMAEATAGLWGIETVLIEKENQLLPYVLDSEISKIVEREFKRQDITLHLGKSVQKIDIDNDSKPVAAIDGANSITADYIFLCLGVYPNSSLAKQCGLEMGKTGGIIVNEKMQTSDPDIYAGGDCVESFNLISRKEIYLPMGSLANRHGRVIAENIAGNKTKFKGVLGSFLIKTFDLNVGAVGLSEKSAIENGIKAASVWGAFPDKPDYYPEAGTFSLKMTYEPESGRLLGLQAVGNGDIYRRIDSFAAFLNYDAVIDDLFNLEHGYAPPYSEALDPLHHMAAIARNKEKGIDFVNPGSKFPDNTVWLDVRETDEIETLPWPYNKGQIHSIPLNDLEDRLDELDKNKKIIIICRRGARSYQAAIILKKAGFENIQIVGGGTQAALS
jgi:NADPH-dependent 2,4-dienoyl-CoA reductase/sulfur reductase-like enzyme/rhodanese-related sulfurtransferase